MNTSPGTSSIIPNTAVKGLIYLELPNFSFLLRKTLWSTLETEVTLVPCCFPCPLLHSPSPVNFSCFLHPESICFSPSSLPLPQPRIRGSSCPIHLLHQSTAFQQHPSSQTPSHLHPAASGLSKSKFQWLSTSLNKKIWMWTRLPGSARLLSTFSNPPHYTCAHVLWP